MKFLVLGYDGKDEGALDRRMAVRAIFNDEKVK